MQRSAFEIRPLVFFVRRSRKIRRSVVRSAILIFLAILAFAMPAHAQGTWLETRLIRAVCGSKVTSPANTDRLAKRLNLTDTQKAAPKDLAEASASADATVQTSLCAEKPDFSTTPGRMAFAEKMAESKLAGLKAVEPKASGVLRQPGREAEESVRHWRAYRRHIRLVA